MQGADVNSMCHMVKQMKNTISGRNLGPWRCKIHKKRKHKSVTTIHTLCTKEKRMSKPYSAHTINKKL